MGWTLIYALITISGITAWRAAPTAAKAEWVIALFALNGFLNITWSLIFFRMQRPDWAFIELILLWLSILVLIIYCVRFSRSAAALLVPYLAWVSFAGALNWAVVDLNAPFG
jgi:tryptophan-rich sensory protein